MGNLIGLYEVAQKAGVTTAAVTNWRNRFSNFPKPDVELKSGPVFNEGQIEAWLRKRGKIMGAKVIATINLKGGVAKTTTTVGLATLLSGTYGKKVLTIDLDPQTNATTMLIGEKKWEELNYQGYTLATLFKDAIYESSNFNLDKTIQKQVSNIRDVTSIDLLPSSIDLIDLQDKLITMPSGKFYSTIPTEILKRAIRKIVDNYDYVLIDCPPNMGLITLNGLRIADGYIIPTIPDVLSTYGIPQIVKRVSEFSENIGEEIECLGIVATKVRGQSELHQRTLELLKAGKKDAPLFNTVFYENNQIGEAAEYVPINTLRQKWGYQGQYDKFNTFTNEIIKKFEGCSV